MKLKKIIFLLFITAALLGCDSLIASKKPRTNPNDSLSTIPAVIDFTAENSSVDNIWGAWLSWSAAAVDIDTDIEGYLIIRKAGSEPESIWDGSLVTLKSGADAPEYFDSREAEGYPLGRRVYYAVFTYGSGSSDSNEETMLQIDSETGVLNNYEKYSFNGPVSDWVNIWATEELPVADDDYIGSGGFWGDDNKLIVTSDAAAGASSISCLTFDLSDIPEGNIEYVQIALTIADSSSDNSIIVAPFDFDWTGSTWSNISTGTAVDDQFEKTMDVAGVVDEVYYLNITDIFFQWNENRKDNFGLRLFKDESAAFNFQFFSSRTTVEEKRPKMQVFYWNY